MNNDTNEYNHTEYFQCECGPCKLPLTLDAWQDDGHPRVLSLTPHLRHYRSFWQRIIPALRYLFGDDDSATAYGEYLIKREDAPRIRQMLLWLEDKSDNARF